MFTVLTLGAIRSWWQNNGFTSKRTVVCGGLELGGIALQCVWTIQPTLLASAGPQRMQTAAALEEEGSTMPCPLHSSSGTSVPQDIEQLDQSCSFQPTRGWRELQTKRAGTAGPAQRRAGPRSGTCRHHWRVPTPLTCESAGGSHSSSISCTLPPQSLAAVDWRRHSPARKEITSDNSGKHVCYPFMHASNLGPKSGCAKRFSPEEMCLLINIYWINRFPICSAVLLRLEALLLLLKGGRRGDYPGGSSEHFSQYEKLIYVFVFIKFTVYPSMVEDMENAFKISNP